MSKIYKILTLLAFLLSTSSYSQAADYKIKSRNKEVQKEFELDISKKGIKVEREVRSEERDLTIDSKGGKTWAKSKSSKCKYCKSKRCKKCSKCKKWKNGKNCKGCKNCKSKNCKKRCKHCKYCKKCKHCKYCKGNRQAGAKIKSRTRLLVGSSYGSLGSKAFSPDGNLWNVMSSDQRKEINKNITDTEKNVVAGKDGVEEAIAALKTAEKALATTTAEDTTRAEKEGDVDKANDNLNTAITTAANANFDYASAVSVKESAQLETRVVQEERSGPSLTAELGTRIDMNGFSFNAQTLISIQNSVATSTGYVAENHASIFLSSEVNAYKSLGVLSSDLEFGIGIRAMAVIGRESDTAKNNRLIPTVNFSSISFPVGFKLNLVAKDGLSVSIGGDVGLGFATRDFAKSDNYTMVNVTDESSYVISSYWWAEISKKASKNVSFMIKPFIQYYSAPTSLKGTVSVNDTKGGMDLSYKTSYLVAGVGLGVEF